VLNINDAVEFEVAGGKRLQHNIRRRPPRSQLDPQQVVVGTAQQTDKRSHLTTFALDGNGDLVSSGFT
jgi:hypothetical protein